MQHIAHKLRTISYVCYGSKIINSRNIEAGPVELLPQDIGLVSRGDVTTVEVTMNKVRQCQDEPHKQVPYGICSTIQSVPLVIFLPILNLL